MQRGEYFSVFVAVAMLTVLALRNAEAGSAVAFSRADNGVVVSAGPPMEVAKQHALADARRKYGAGVQIIGATDMAGYGAVAEARHPNGIGWIICVSLACRSATEADTLARNKCLKLGGKNPQVRLAFRG